MNNNSSSVNLNKNTQQNESKTKDNHAALSRISMINHALVYRWWNHQIFQVKKSEVIAQVCALSN